MAKSKIQKGWAAQERQAASIDLKKMLNDCCAVRISTAPNKVVFVFPPKSNLMHHFHTSVIEPFIAQKILAGPEGAEVDLFFAGIKYKGLALDENLPFVKELLHPPERAHITPQIAGLVSLSRDNAAAKVAAHFLSLSKGSARPRH